jgi:hypothetical protein
MLTEPQRSDGTGLELLDLESVDQVVGTVSKRLASAHDEVRVSGNDCKFIVESRLADLRKTLARGVKIKILCADPAVPSIAAMLPVVDERFRTPREFTDSMISVARTLSALHVSGETAHQTHMWPACALPMVDTSFCAISQANAAQSWSVSSRRRTRSRLRPRVGPILPSGIPVRFEIAA